MKTLLHKTLFFVLAAIALLGFIDSVMALVLGFSFAILLKNPFKSQSKKAVSYLLKIAIVGLGFGMFIKD